MGWRQERLQRRIGGFMRQYTRKRQPGWDPNDRGYDRKVEAQVKRLDPRELDAMLGGETGVDKPSEEPGVE